jgi:hypothetical protein
MGFEPFAACCKEVPTDLLSSGLRSGGKGGGPFPIGTLKSVTHFHPVPRLRISGELPPPLHSFRKANSLPKKSPSACEKLRANIIEVLYKGGK